MSERKLKSVSLEVDGRVIELRASSGRLRRIEDDFDKDLSDVLGRLEGRLSVTVLAKVLQHLAGLPSIDEADAILDAVGMETVAEKVGEAVIAAMPSASAEGNAEAPAA